MAEQTRSETRLSVVAGLGVMFGALRFFARKPQSWPFALVPVAVLLLLIAGTAFVSIAFVRPTVANWIAGSAAFLGRFGAQVGSWLAAVLSVALGIWVAVGLAAPLSAPALERIVHLQERELAAPARAPLGWLAEMWSGLRAQLFALVVATPIFVALWLLALLVPPLAIIVVPLEFLLASLLLAYNLLDYPLTLRGVPIRQRLRLMRRQWRATVGFGIGFSLLFWLPCFTILFLPIGVAAATRLTWQMAARDAWIQEAVGEGPRVGSTAPR